MQLPIRPRARCLAEKDHGRPSEPSRCGFCRGPHRPLEDRRPRSPSAVPLTEVQVAGASIGIAAGRAVFPSAEVARAEFHRAVRRLHLTGVSLRELAAAAGDAAICAESLAQCREIHAESWPNPVDVNDTYSTPSTAPARAATHLQEGATPRTTGLRDRCWALAAMPRLAACSVTGRGRWVRIRRLVVLVSTRA